MLADLSTNAGEVGEEISKSGNGKNACELVSCHETKGYSMREGSLSKGSNACLAHSAKPPNHDYSAENMLCGQYLIMASGYASPLVLLLSKRPRVAQYRSAYAE